MITPHIRSRQRIHGARPTRTPETRCFRSFVKLRRSRRGLPNRANPRESARAGTMPPRPNTQQAGVSPGSIERAMDTFPPRLSAVGTPGMQPSPSQKPTAQSPENYQDATKCYHGLVASDFAVWPQQQGKTAKRIAEKAPKTCKKLPDATKLP